MRENIGMNVIDYYWDHPVLQPYLKTIPAGQYLFREAQLGNTMFIIVRGLVELIAERRGKEYVVHLVPAGQFLGEKAVIRASFYRRTYSARTQTATQVVELDLHAIDSVRKAAPDLMNDIFKQMFQVEIQRLDSANLLANGLRSTNNLERLIHLLLYFCQTTGFKAEGGTEFVLNPDTIYYYIEMETSEIKRSLDDLAQQKLLIRLKDSRCLIPNKMALIESIPNLKEQLNTSFLEALAS